MRKENQEALDYLKTKNTTGRNANQEALEYLRSKKPVDDTVEKPVEETPVEKPADTLKSIKPLTDVRQTANINEINDAKYPDYDLANPIANMSVEDLQKAIKKYDSDVLQKKHSNEEKTNWFSPEVANGESVTSAFKQNEKNRAYRTELEKEYHRKKSEQDTKRLSEITDIARNRDDYESFEYDKYYAVHGVASGVTHTFEQSLEPEEYKTYTYLQQYDPELAKEYKQLMTDTLNERASERTVESMTKLAEEHPVFASGLSTAINFGSGVGIIETLSGDIDENSPWYLPSKAVKAIRDTVGAKLAQEYSAEVFGINVANLLYQSGMSIVDNVTQLLVGAALTGGFANAADAFANGTSFVNKSRSAVQAAFQSAEPIVLALMSTSAATSSAIEAKANGASDGQVVATAIISGFAEYFSEKCSLDYFLKSATPSTIRQLLKQVAAQAGVEGSEEVFSDLINQIGDALINGDKNQIQRMYDDYMVEYNDTQTAWQKTIADVIRGYGESFAGGALSGLVMGGFASTMNYAGVSAIDAQEGAKKRFNKGLSNMDANETWNKDADSALLKTARDIAAKSDNNESSKYADKLQKKVDKGKSLSDLELGRLSRLSKENIVDLAEKEMGKADQLSKFAENAYIGEDGLRNLIDFSSNTEDIAKLAEDFTGYYNAGFNGESFEDVDARLSERSTLSDEQKRTAYNSGVIDITTEKAELNKEGNKLGLDLRRSGKWANRKDSQRPVSAMEEGAGSNQSRNIQTNRERPADAELAKGTALKTNGKITAEQYGVGQGVTQADRLATESYSPSVKKAESLVEARGMKFVPFVNSNLDTNGGIVGIARARGAYGKDTILARADHKMFTALQIVEHEIFHDMVNKGEVMLDEVLEGFRKNIDPDTFNQVLDAYMYDYAGSDLTSDRIFEELCADLYAGMNTFNGRISVYSQAIDKASQVAKGVIEENAKKNSGLAPPAEEISDAPDSSPMHSIESYGQMCGFEFDSSVKRGGYNWYVEDANGNRTYITNDNPVTMDMLKGSPIENFLATAFALRKQEGIETDDSYVKDRLKLTRDFANLILKYGNLRMIYELSGANAFTVVRANSEEQYGWSVDMASICKKTESIMNAISKRMLERYNDFKNGKTIYDSKGKPTTEIALDKDQILDLYYEQVNKGEMVPCPYCYVFSRWLGVGSRLNRIWDYQQKYIDATPEQIQQAINKAKKVVFNYMEGKSLTFGKARSELVDKAATAYNKILMITQDQNYNPKDARTKEAIDKIIEKSPANSLAELTYIVDNLEEYTWLTDVRTKSGYAPVDGEILFDLGRAADFATLYPSAWAWRKKGGSAGGKAIMPFSSAWIGDYVKGVMKGDAQYQFDKNGKVVNPYATGKVDAKAMKTFLNALMKQRTQNLMGGTRVQSWSDFKESLISDWFIELLNMEALHAKIQGYTKVIEGCDMWGSVGASINCSIAGEGKGYVTRNGKNEIVTSNMTGMELESAVSMMEKYPTIGTIIIGTSDTQIELCLNDKRIRMVIPYHASGNTKEALAEMMNAVDDAYSKLKKEDWFTDYTDYQTDKLVTMDMLRKGTYAPSTNAPVYDLTPVKVYITDANGNMDFSIITTNRSARKNLLTGKALTPAEQKAVRNSRFLTNIQNILNSEEYKGSKLTDKQAEQIYPFEFWDTDTTYDTSDVNSRNFVDYCTELGIVPRFYQFSDQFFYWKTLVDRNMYDYTTGLYVEQPYINTEGLMNIGGENNPLVNIDSEGKYHLLSSRYAGHTQEDYARKYYNPNRRFRYSTDIITRDMSDADRAEILRHKYLDYSTTPNYEKLEIIRKKNNLPEDYSVYGSRDKLFKTIGEEFGVYKKFENKDIKLDFNFSRKKMSESVHWLGHRNAEFIKMLSILDDVVENAVGIQVHNYNDDPQKHEDNLKDTYVLVSAFTDGKQVVPVELEVKELIGQDNILYLVVALESITKDDLDKIAKSSMSRIKVSDDNVKHLTPLGVSVADFLTKINPSDQNFVKYIPEELRQATEVKGNTKNSIDTDYISLAQQYESNPNDKSVQKQLADMVRAEAIKKGYDSPDLYHGTSSFGFDRFDLSLSDDGETIFATTNDYVASSYTQEGTTRELGRDNKPKLQYFSKHKIVNNRVQEMTASDLVKMVNDSGILGIKVEQVTDSQYRKEAEKRFNRVREKLDDIERTYSLKEYPKLKALIDDVLKAETAEDFKKIRYDLTEIEEEVYQYNNLWSAFNAASNLIGSLNQWANRDYLKVTSGSFTPPIGMSMIAGDYVREFALANAYNAQAHAANGEEGVYHLYGKTANLFKYNARFSQWNELRQTKEMERDFEGTDWDGAFLTTRLVCEWAKEKGYSGVAFYNIYDNFSNETDQEASDVYAFFNPNDVKSADLVTYDKNGDIIPISERFNDTTDNLKYSIDTTFRDEELVKQNKDLEKDYKALGNTQVSISYPTVSKIAKNISEAYKAENTAETRQAIKNLAMKLGSGKASFEEIKDAAIDVARNIVKGSEDLKVDMTDIPASEAQLIESVYDPGTARAIEYCANDIILDVLEAAAAQKATNKQVEKLRQKLKDQRLAGIIEAHKEMAEARRIREEKIQAVKDHYHAVEELERARKDESQARQKLLRVVRRLSNKKLDNANRAMIDELIKDIDTTAVSMTIPTIEKLTNLRDWYEDKVKNDPDFLSDPNIEDAIGRLAKKQIKDMTIQDVRELTDVLLNIENELRTEHQLLDETERRTIYDLGLKIIDDIDSAKGFMSKRELVRYLNMGVLTPERFFRRITGYAIDDPLQKVAQRLSEGQRKALDYQMRAYAKFRRWTEDKQIMQSLIGKKAKTVTIFDGANPVEITPAMKISLYLHGKNDQNLRHIMLGGIKIPDMKLYREGKIGEAYDRSTRVIKMKPSEVKAITLTPQEKAFADAVYDYFNGMSQEEINKVSEVLKGYSLAKVANYFPINTDSNFQRNHLEYGTLKQDGTLEGMGFLKERIQKAQSPIMLFDVTQILDKAIRDTSKYVGLAIPVRDMNKLLGVAKTNLVEGSDGDIKYERYSGSVMQSINSRMSGTAEKYIANLMSDLQNGTRADSTLDSIFNQVRSLYAGATLSMNLGVALKQTASYPTAAAVLGWSPLAKALKDTSKVDIDTIAKYTPMYWTRAQGFSLQELGDLRKLDDNILAKALSSKALNWIQAMDLATTRKLWLASEYYVREHNRSLARGSDAYYKEVAKVYNKTIEETQPNYTDMQRPELLRQKSMLGKILFMFKTQPFQNYNILYDAINNYKAQKNAYLNDKEMKPYYDEAKRTLANAISSQIVSGLMFSAIGVLWKFLRGKYDKDEDMLPDDVWQFFKDLGFGAISNAAGMFPLGSDVADAAEWLADVIFKQTLGDKVFNAYLPSTTVPFLDAIISAVEDAGTTVRDIFQGKGVAAIAEDIMDMAKDAGVIAGLPIANAYNIVMAIAYWIRSAIDKAA